MNLYCWQHNTTHRLTNGVVERLVYALTAAYADEVTEPDGDRIHAGEHGDEHMVCPLRALAWDDIEVYAEWVEQGVECRRVHEREARDAA